MGYYREPDGRIGAAQLVTIPKAKDFVRRLNGLINAQTLEGNINGSDPLARTQKRMRAAAKADHQWITLEGHTIRFTMPVHPGEWARGKGEFLRDVAGELTNLPGGKEGEEIKNRVKFSITALSAAPVSYLDEGDQVTFIVGQPKRPSTLRLQIRDEYEPSLEKVVIENAKVDLDDALAKALLLLLATKASWFNWTICRFSCTYCRADVAAFLSACKAPPCAYSSQSRAGSHAC